MNINHIFVYFRATQPCFSKNRSAEKRYEIQRGERQVKIIDFGNGCKRRTSNRSLKKIDFSIIVENFSFEKREEYGE
jgi:hypothetical protein